MNNIVGIIGLGGEGGTFLDWSLHYLAGDRYITYVVVDRDNDCIQYKQRWLPIYSNPLLENGIAHKHHKTHPTEKTLPECIEIVNRYVDDNIKIHTMYIVGKSTSYGDRGFYQLVDDLITANPSIKYVRYHYTYDVRKEYAERILTKIPNSKADRVETYQNMEMLCTEPVIYDSRAYTLLARDMFYNLEIEIYKIFEYLQLDIDKNLYDKWVNVYREWQAKNNLAQNSCLQ